jgi:hypothetical protein
MSTTECVICCEKLNKRRTEISCIHCNKKCCSTCFGTRLLSSEPGCMFCGEVFPDDFIAEKMTLSFNDSYRKHRYEQEFTREESLLPETQERAEREKEARVLDAELQEKQIQLESSNKHIHNLKNKLFYKEKDQKEQKDNKALSKQLKKEIKEEKTEIKIHKIHRDCLLEQMRNIRRNIDILRRSRPTEVEKEKKKYTRPCPDDKCRGFLSSAYKCGTCEKYFCSDCHVLKNGRDDKEHTCDEGVKASVKMINLDSKPCPKCSSYIYRTEGCSLMWCVKCHTQFDWNTLQIKHGYNHNPEYFRYLRETGTDIPRNPLDAAINCDLIPRDYELARKLRPLNIGDILWQDIYRSRHHIIDVVMRSLPSRVEMIDCTDLRIGYLLSDFDKEKWKRTYFKRMKKNEINHERYKVLDMYCNVIKDNFLNLMTETSVEAFNTFKDSCERIEKYADEQLLRINKKYKSKCKYLNIKNLSS